MPGLDCSRIAGRVNRGGLLPCHRPASCSDRTGRAASAPFALARVVAVVNLLATIALSVGASTAAAQTYKDRKVIEVLRAFQQQGVRVVFSSALVTPDMRVGDEPDGDDPEGVINAILAPHNLTVRVGLRGILLVVRATSRPGGSAGATSIARPGTTHASSDPNALVIAHPGRNVFNA